MYVLKKDADGYLRGAFAEHANTAAFNIIAVIPLMIIIAAAFMPALFLLGIMLGFDSGRFMLISLSVLVFCAAAAGKRVLQWALSVSRSDRTSAGAAATVCAAAAALFAVHESSVTRILICFAVNAALMISAYLVLHRKDKAALMLTLSVLLLFAFMLTAVFQDGAGLLYAACAGALLPFAVPAAICAWFDSGADAAEDEPADSGQPYEDGAEADKEDVREYPDAAEVRADDSDSESVAESDSSAANPTISVDESNDESAGEQKTEECGEEGGSDDMSHSEDSVSAESAQSSQPHQDRALAAALLREANALYKAGKHADALEKYQASCDLNRTDRLEAFIANLKNILSAQELVRSANAFYRDKKYDEALALYRESLGFYKSDDIERFIVSLQKKIAQE